jgi:TPR repeat protein
LAKKYYEMAAKQGNQMASTILQTGFEPPPYLKETPQKSLEDRVKEADFKGTFSFQNKDYKNAFIQYSFSANNGNINSASNIAILYENGWVFRILNLGM